MVCDELKKGENVADAEIKGGLTRQVRVTLDSARLAGYGLSPLVVMSALQKGNASLYSGASIGNTRESRIETGAFLDGAESVRRVVVGSTTAPLSTSTVWCGTTTSARGLIWPTSR